MIKLINNSIDSDDIKLLIDWLKKNPKLTYGEVTESFEKEFSEWLGSKYSIFVNSGSSANLLMIDAIKHLLKDKKLKVVVPAMCWNTTISPIIKFGLEPIICDVNLNDYNIDLEKLEYVFKKYKPDVLMLVHILGFPADINEIKFLCGKYNVYLLEDTCESMGSMKNYNQMIGTDGLISSFSLFFGHHISTIEGGFVCTDDNYTNNYIRMVMSHGWDRKVGITYREYLRKKFNISDFDSLYTFYEPGYNLRSTDLQAFIGLNQIKKLPTICEKRYKNFILYQHYVKKYENRPSPNGYFISNFAYPIITERRNELIEELRVNEIECRPLISGCITKHPFMEKISYKKTDLSIAEYIHDNSLYVPNHPGLSENDIERISHIINNYI